MIERSGRSLRSHAWVVILAAAALLIAVFAAAGCGGSGRANPATAPGGPASAKAAGPYLGQPLPGEFAQSFASGIVKGELHTPPVFTPDGTEAYWSLQGSTIRMSKLVNGAWTEPKIVSLSAATTDFRDPCISPSGDELFFLSKGTLPGASGPAKENVWVAGRTVGGWGEPKPLGDAVNSLTIHWQISVAANGDLYFSSGVPDGVGDIFVSRFVGGSYAKAAKLDGPVNTPGIELTPHIAPDQSYLLFSRLDEQTGDARLWVSFADANGVWGEPASASGIGYALAPTVSPDGKYLFFLSSPQSVSWMTTDFLKGLKHGQ